MYVALILPELLIIVIVSLFETIKINNSYGIRKAQEVLVFLSSSQISYWKHTIKL